MPNGTNYDEATWARVQEYLEPTEALWSNLADRLEGEVVRDYHNLPGRSVTWTDTLTRKILLSLCDQDLDLFALNLFAWADESGTRRIRHERLTGDLAGAKLAEELPRVLEAAVSTVCSWKEESLVERPATSWRPWKRSFKDR